MMILQFVFTKLLHAVNFFMITLLFHLFPDVNTHFIVLMQTAIVLTFQRQSLIQIGTSTKF